MLKSRRKILEVADLPPRVFVDDRRPNPCDRVFQHDSRPVISSHLTIQQQQHVAVAIDRPLDLPSIAEHCQDRTGISIAQSHPSVRIWAEMWLASHV